MLQRLLVSLILWLSLAGPAVAGIWVSASTPTSFAFSSSGNGIYDFYQGGSTNASGYGLLFNLPVPLLPVVGLSEFKIDILPTSPYITGTNQVKFNTYDVALDFSGKMASFVLGYGTGQALFTCSQSDCAGLTFRPREVTQYFTQLGIPFGPNSDFHLEARRLIGRVQVDSGVQAADLDLQGMLLGFGFKIGF